MAISLTLHAGFPAGTAYARSVGQATSSGVGHSLFTGVGAAAGVAVANGVGASSTSTGVGVGASAGAATATGVGHSLASGVGSAAGVATVTGSSAGIEAVVADGVQGYKKHTGGPTGAADGPAITIVASRTFNSDGSAMSIRRIINGTGTVVSLRRTATNTIEFKGYQSDATTEVFSCVTTAVAASLGPLIILASANGTTAVLKVVHAAGTITGTNTPGTAGDLDLGGSDWWYDQSGVDTEFGDYDIHLDWDDDSFIDFTNSDNIEQFWDTAADKLRQPGVDGSNPVDGAFSPLVCHKSGAAAHVVNSGTGGDADTAGTFTDGTSPGTYAADHDGDPALGVLATAVAWWEADHASNTHAGGFFSQLADLSGNGNHLVQATGANQPARLDASGIISAEFDATDDAMDIASPTAALMNNFDTGGTCVFILLSDTTGEAGFGRIFDKNGGDTLINWNAIRYVLQTDHATTDGQLQTTTQVAMDVKRLVAYRYNKAVGTSGAIHDIGNSKFTVGSGLTVNIASSGAAADGSGFAFTLGNRTARDRTFDGGIYAGAFFDTELSDTDLGYIKTYWATKFGVTL